MDPVSCLFTLNEGQGESRLILVLALLVGVTFLAWRCRLEKNQLGNPLAGVNLSWQGGCVADFYGHPTPPFRLERSDVHNDSAAGIGAFTNTNAQHVPWYL